MSSAHNAGQGVPNAGQGASNAGQGASHAGQNAGNALKEGFAKLHGAGEMIRGNINTFADSVTNTDESKSRNVTEKGLNEMETGHYHGTGAGVTPKDTTTERLNRDIQGEGGHIGTGQTTYGTERRA